MTRQVTITCTPKQADAIRLLDDPLGRRYLFDGAARTGKTLASMLWLLNQMHVHPGLRVACLRQHRVHARATLLDATIRPLLVGRSAFSIADSAMQVVHRNGSMMLIDGLDDDASVDKILGNEFGAVFLNEATQMSWRGVKTVVSRLAQSLPGLAKRTLILDCNPKGPTHWLYQVGIQHVDPDTGKPLADAECWRRMAWQLADNPHLPADAVAGLNALTGVEKLRLAEGMWAASDGLVYKEFDRAVHCVHVDVDKLGVPVQWILGVDCGWAPDPMVLGLFACWEESGRQRMHLHGLVYERGKDMSMSLGDAARKWLTLDPLVVVDPSASPAMLELKTAGFRVEPADNSIAKGIAAVRDMLATARLTFSPDFAGIVCDEFAQYELNDRTDKPMQGTPDHCLDMTRYSAMALNSLTGEANPFYVF